MESETQGVDAPVRRIESSAPPDERRKLPDPRLKPRLVGLLVFIGLLCVVFHRALWAWVLLAFNESLHSHVILIPFASAYLVWLRKEALPWDRVETSPLLATVVFIGASAFWVMAEARGLQGPDWIAFVILAFVAFLVGGGFLFLGREWMAAIAFPAVFLFFLVPLPDFAVQALERASQLASAEAADLLFSASGLPYFRDGLRFQLSNVNLEVAQECSGIRSSLVLFITGAFASNLLLQTNWRRWVLTLVVIPLGVLRNGFRIVTLGFLAVHFGPPVLETAIHHRGGPIFFVLSLIPLLAIVWWLRRSEHGRRRRE